METETKSTRTMGKGAGLQYALSFAFGWAFSIATLAAVGCVGEDEFDDVQGADIGESTAELTSDQGTEPTRVPDLMAGDEAAASGSTGIPSSSNGADNDAFIGDEVSVESTNCSALLSRTSYSYSCRSDWPWESFNYSAWVGCTPNGERFSGALYNSYWHRKSSVAQCPSGRTVNANGVEIR